MNWQRLREAIRNASLCGLGLLVGAVLNGATSHQVAAQSQAQPAVLMAITATDGAQGETRLVLTFASPAPKYSVIKNDSDKPAIALSPSSRGVGATMPANTHGLLRAIDFDQKDTILILDFSTSQASRITVTPIGDRALSIDFTDPTRSQSGASGGPVAPVLLPKASVRDPSEDGFEIVALKYADVSEVVGLLTDGLTVKSNDTFTPQEPAFGSAGMSAAAQPSLAPPPGQAVAGESMGQSVDDAIGIDRRLNAIILKGTPARIARLKAKIEAIDVPVESVVLETMFVELDESGARNVGINFNNTSAEIAVATVQTGGDIPSGFSTKSALTSVALQAAVYAQVQKGHGRIVSKPRIAAQSGSTAKIITGDALPILTSITLSGVNAVSQQVQYVNVGVTLQIAPRVSSDGFVTSHVFCVVSSVTGTSQGYPTISQREAETSATVRDGETFVIGGLTEESDIKSDSKVPILGDVPGFGALFRVSNGTRAKTELYIVVTPRIVRRPHLPLSPMSESGVGN